MNTLSPTVSRFMGRFKAVTAKRASMALGLWGEAGIGKTYTAQALLKQLSCRSFSVHATAPLPVLAATFPRPAKLSGWAERSLQRLERGEPLSSTTAQALAALLSALAPVVLHVEDLHEATAERLELWQALAQGVRRTRGVGLLASSRTSPPADFEAHRLEPLSSEASNMLLEAEVGSLLPTEATRWIFQQTVGNPLFTLEYFRYLARAGYLWNDGRQWRWRKPEQVVLPASVEALIEQLITRAKAIPQHGHVLEARSLLGADVELAVWSRVAGVSEAELQAAVTTLSQQGILQEQTFAHPLFREMTLGTMVAERRRDLARLALEALRDAPEEAAAFVEDAELDDAQALELLTAAAAHANDEVRAAGFLAQAAPHAEGERRGRLALEAANVLQHHNLPEATRLLELALQTPVATTETVRLYAHLLARQGRVPVIEALLEGLPAQLRARVQPVSLAITASNIAGDHHAALATWEAHPELHDQPSPELLRAVAASALATGRVKEAETLTTQGLGVALGGGLRAEFLSLKSLILFHRGDYAEAEVTIRETLALLTGMNAPRPRSTALLNRAAFLRMLGDYATMGECLEECLLIRQEAGDGKGYAFALTALAELRLEQGRYEEAEDVLSEAFATLELHGPSRFLANAHSMASVLYAAQAIPLSNLLALKHGEQALSYARQLGSPRVIREMLFDASLANTRAGNIQRGLSLAQESQALAEAAGNAPNDNFRTLWALALAEEAAGHFEQAAGHLREALSLAWTAEVALDAQKIGLELDRLKGDSESARTRLSWFEEHGLANGANIARRYFPELEPSLAPAPTEEALRLEVLGAMRFIRSEKAETVRGSRRQALLARLLEARLAGRTEVSQSALAEAFYPLSEDAADAVKQLVFQVRARWGQGCILTTASGYALGRVASDAEAFLAGGDTLLWRGEYLAGVEDADEGVREALYHTLQERLRELVKRDPGEAVRVGRLLIAAEPYALEPLRLTLRALEKHSPKAMVKLYQESRERLAEVGESLPETPAAFLTITPAQPPTL